MYKIFGKYGPIRQIRLGSTPTTQGTAFVVYDDIYDAFDAVRGMSGFNVGGRYVVVLYFQQSRVRKQVSGGMVRREFGDIGTVKLNMKLG